ncbi:MAG: rod shape-determining protein MreC [Thermodesulfovibrionales bacterium]
MKFKPVFFLILLVIFISFLSSKVFGPLKYISYPYDLLSLSISKGFHVLSDQWQLLSWKKEKIESIKKEMDLLTERLAEYENIKRENILLKELLSLRESQKKTVTFASVIRRGLARWSDAIVIDKGESDGIKKDMVVITPRGLVGKVLVANNDFSEVLLLDDSNFRVAVRFLGTRTEGIATGTGHGVVIKYVPKDAEVIKGDWVITSGLDGIFPEGILVGYVADIREKEVFKEVILRTAQDLRSLEYVAIVTR